MIMMIIMIINHFHKSEKREKFDIKAVERKKIDVIPIKRDGEPERC